MLLKQRSLEALLVVSPVFERRHSHHPSAPQDMRHFRPHNTAQHPEDALFAQIKIRGTTESLSLLALDFA